MGAAMDVSHLLIPRLRKNAEEDLSDIVSTFRMLVKIAFLEFRNPGRVKVNVIIYGAGEAGITAKRVLDQDTNTRYKVLAFIDDDAGQAGKKLEGIDIVSPDKLDSLLMTGTVEQVILAVHSISLQKKRGNCRPMSWVRCEGSDGPSHDPVGQR